MADQVTPTGGLAPGVPLQILVATASKSVSDTPRPAKSADPQSQGAISEPASEPQKSPDVAVQKLNGHLQGTGSELRFQVDKSTGRTIFKLVEPNSGKVLLQVPSEEVLAMARHLQAVELEQGAIGVLVNKEG